MNVQNKNYWISTKIYIFVLWTFYNSFDSAEQGYWKYIDGWLKYGHFGTIRYGPYPLRIKLSPGPKSL